MLATFTLHERDEKKKAAALGLEPPALPLKIKQLHRLTHK
jgi:hypothetical protein